MVYLEREENTQNKAEPELRPEQRSETRELPVSEHTVYRSYRATALHTIHCTVTTHVEASQ